MSLATQADDWQVVCTGVGGFGLLISGALFSFVFFSKKADISALFWFRGTGWGLGGNMSGGASDPDDWSKIDCSGNLGLSCAFSVYDLDKSPGHVATAGVGAGIGYSVVYISAGPQIGFKTPFFSVQSVGGLGMGAGLGAASLTGSWGYKKISRLRAE